MADHVSSDLQAASGMSPKTLNVYLIGFVLCLIITIAAFLLAGMHLMSMATTLIALAVLAVIQLYVQVICFLRLNTSRDGIWNVMSFLFTLLIVGVIVGGSIWIMLNLNYYMMH